MGHVEIDRAVFIVVGRPRSIQIGIATTGFVSGCVGGVGVTVDILLVLPLDDALLPPVVVAVSPFLHVSTRQCLLVFTPHSLASPTWSTASRHLH